MSHAQPVKSEPEGRAAIGSPRNFVLACIGLLSLAVDEIPALLERSVQRGSAVVEQAQAEARRRRAAPPEPAPQKPAPQSQAEGQIDLFHPGLPTHRDFETLLQQVTELEQQIDQITAQRAAAR